MVLIEHHRGALYRKQGVAIENGAGGEHGVDPFSGGENVGEAREDVAFVVVGYGVAQVQGVGGIRLQRLFKVDYDALSLDAVLGLFGLGRGQEDALGVLDAHVLVEGEDYLLLFGRETHRARIRLDVHDVWGYRVLVAAAGRLRGVRAGMREQEREQHQRRADYGENVSSHIKYPF